MPPYSPDLSPIELCWSKLKQFLRSCEARTLESRWPCND
ncbi:transposase [Nostoc linckia FACHB-104]|nr:transposase [Nostoc linckia FACHB-104]